MVAGTQESIDDKSEGISSARPGMSRPASSSSCTVTWRGSPVLSCAGVCIIIPLVTGSPDVWSRRALHAAVGHSVIDSGLSAGKFLSGMHAKPH